MTLRIDNLNSILRESFLIEITANSCWKLSFPVGFFQIRKDSFSALQLISSVYIFNNDKGTDEFIFTKSNLLNQQDDAKVIREAKKTVINFINSELGRESGRY